MPLASSPYFQISLSLNLPQFDSAWILENRGAKNKVDPKTPYAYLVEQERSSDGVIENVGTVFLTNHECPFRCLMCDLWKNTTDYTVSSNELVHQIEWALNEFKSRIDSPSNSLQSLKLYNSGNFFDKKAIPQSAIQQIQAIVNVDKNDFEWKRLIIENHPKLVGASSLEFAKDLKPRLEVAMGLETIHPDVLPSLNKQMTLDDFKRATDLLNNNGIEVRAFILLKPPFLNDKEGVEWALKSIDWAFQNGVNCCAVIPTRVGNGSMEKLVDLQHFSEPKFSAMESLMDEGFKLKKTGQRLFIDLWDSARFADCQICFESRRDRLHHMNLYQQTMPNTTACDQCNFPNDN